MPALLLTRSSMRRTRVHGSLRIYKPEGANARGVILRILLEIVPYIPERSVVRRIYHGISIIFPAQGIGLRSLPFRKDPFAKTHDARGVTRKAAGESLPGKLSLPPKRIADPDVAFFVRRDPRQPAPVPTGCVCALLIEAEPVMPSASKLIPAYAATPCGRPDGMRNDIRFLFA